MSERRYEVEATMYAIVHYIATIQSAFVLEKAFVLLIYVFEYGVKTIWIIDGIAKARCIDYR